MTDQPETLDLRSQDIAEDKRQELLRLLPEVRTEGGKLDFERLRLAGAEHGAAAPYSKQARQDSLFDAAGRGIDRTPGLDFCEPRPATLRRPRRPSLTASPEHVPRLPSPRPEYRGRVQCHARRSRLESLPLGRQRAKSTFSLDVLPEYGKGFRAATPQAGNPPSPVGGSRSTVGLLPQ